MRQEAQAQASLVQKAGREALWREGKGEEGERVGGEARMTQPSRRLSCSALLLGTLGAMLGWVTAPASASPTSTGPAQWAIASVAGPAYFKPASSGDLYIITATNVGGESTQGPVTITDTLHGEAEATAVVDSFTATEGNYGEAFTASPLSCTVSPPASVTCGYAGSVDPGDTLTFAIKVDVTGTEGEVENAATVSGGGAASASATSSTRVSSEPVPFGVASFLAAASTSQAGAHPNFTTSFTPNWSEVVDGLPLPAAALREIGVDLPPGLSGDALAGPRCAMGSVRREECDEDAAVGVATVVIKGNARKKLLVYDITPYPGEPAAFGFSFGKIAAARLDTSVLPGSDGEYAVHVSVPDISEKEPILFSSLTLWAVPALHNGPGPDISNTCHESAGETTCDTFGGPGGQAASARPFLRNPTSCAGSPPVGFEMDSWSEPPGVFPPGEPSAPFPTQAECGLLAPLFTPSLTVAPDTSQAGAPAGYAVDLEVPQSQSSQALGTPDLRDARVTLPAGTVASPSSANGLQACSDAQFGIDESGTVVSNGPASCPQPSQIGTVEIETPLLPKPLQGQVFLGQPQCSPCGASEAEQGKMVRLFLQARYEDGSYVRIKLAGRTHIDQQTGQLTTVFENNPQQPFEKLTLRLDGGPGAPLANPPVCGTATTTSRLTPWSSTPSAPFSAEPSSSFQVEGCPAPRFAPSFSAGMTGSIRAGAYSPFVLRLSREDGSQPIHALNVTLPPGLTGRLAGVGECPDAAIEAAKATGGAAQIASPSCPASSELGTVDVGAGPGPDPFHVTGHAYLAGPYRGAPLSMVTITPALAGPFDLGTVVVRAALYVDPETTQVTVKSDPIPTILDGIPLDVRSIAVDISRNQFTLNPTNCSQLAVTATLTSTEGASAPASSPFEAANCANLPFKPQLKISLKGKTTRAQHPALKAVLTMKPGEANIAKAQVTLPHSAFLDQSHIRTVCTRVQFAAKACPAASVYGHATAITPLLDKPLSGPVYLRSSSNKLPDLVADLNGQIEVTLAGKIDTGKGGGIRNTFQVVPDAPVSKFVLSMQGGAKGLLVNSENLCSPQAKTHAVADFTGQNGKISDTTPTVANSCKSGKHKKGHRRARG
jgi:hypothetical protein